MHKNMPFSAFICTIVGKPDSEDRVIDIKFTNEQCKDKFNVQSSRDLNAIIEKIRINETSNLKEIITANEPV